MLWCKQSKAEVFNNPFRSHIKPVYTKVKKQLQIFKQADETLNLSALVDKLSDDLKALNDMLEFSQLTLAMYLGPPPAHTPTLAHASHQSCSSVIVLLLLILLLSILSNLALPSSCCFVFSFSSSHKPRAGCQFLYKKIPTVTKVTEKKQMVKDLKQQWKDAGIFKAIPEWFQQQLTSAASM